MQPLLHRSLPAVAAMLVLALVSRGSTADAQPASSSSAPASASQQAAARKLTEDALVAEDAKDYAKAIALYQQAYLVVPHTILQFNIGQAYMMAGNLDEAERYFRLYLIREPNGRGSPVVRKFLASRPAAPSPPQAASALESGQPTTSSNGGGSAEHPALDASTFDKKASPQAADGQSLGAPPPFVDVEVRLARGHALKRKGYMVIASGVGLGLAAIGLGFYRGDVGRGVGVAAFLTGVTGVGVCWYANNQITAAKSLSWSPMLGSGVTGIAFTGTYGR